MGDVVDMVRARAVRALRFFRARTDYPKRAATDTMYGPSPAGPSLADAKALESCGWAEVRKLRVASGDFRVTLTRAGQRARDSG